MDRTFAVIYCFSFETANGIRQDSYLCHNQKDVDEVPFDKYEGKPGLQISYEAVSYDGRPHPLVERKEFAL